MTPQAHPVVGWRAWLREQLDARGLRPADLSRRSGGRIESSQLTRWLRGGQTPSFDSVRAVCAALGVPVAEGLVAAGLIDPSEVGAPVVVQERSIEELGDAALLAELARRLARAVTVAEAPTIRGSDVALEWPKDAAPSRPKDVKGAVKRA